MEAQSPIPKTQNPKAHQPGRYAKLGKNKIKEFLNSNNIDSKYYNEIINLEVDELKTTEGYADYYIFIRIM